MHYAQSRNPLEEEEGPAASAAASSGSVLKGKVEVCEG